MQLLEDRGCSPIAQGGSRISRGSSCDVHFPEECDCLPAQVHHAPYGSLMFWRQGLECQQLCLGEQRRERVTDVVS